MDSEYLVSALQAVLDSSADAMVLFDSSLTVHAFNEAARRSVSSMYGAELASGRKVTDFLPRSSAAVFAQDAAKALSGQRVEIERGIPSRRDEGHPYRYVLVPIAKPGEAPWGVTLTLADLGPLRSIEKSLAKRETQYFDLLRALPVVVLIVTDGYYRYGNDAALAMFGLKSLGELVGLHVKTFVPPEDLATTSERLVTSQNGEAHGERQADIVRQDGSRRNLMVQSMYCVYEGKDASLVIARDVTEERKAALWLRTMSYAVEQSPACIVITDPSGRIEYTNPRFTEVTGYASDEIKGKNPKFLKSGETTAEEYERLWRTIRGGGVWRGEFHNVKRSGELYWEDASIGPIKDSEGRIAHFIGVKEIITERKQDEAILRQTLDAKEALIHELHHRTRNNLQILSALISMQIERSGSGPVAEGLEKARGRVLALSAVQEQFLNRDDLSTIDLKEFAEDVIAQTVGARASSETRLSVDADLPRMEVPVDFANPFGLTLYELVSNSARHAFGGRAAGSISVRGAVAHGVLCVEYRDDGVGLDPGDTLVDGSGLGHLILRSLVESQLGGSVTLLPGPGFACSIIMPL